MALLSCTFNNIDIGSLTDTYINAIGTHMRPERKIASHKLVRKDGNDLVNAEYAEKNILVKGFIAAADRATYEAERDTLMKHLQTQEGTLMITQAGASRFYTATVESISWKDNQGGFAAFEINFYCSDPLGRATIATTLLDAVAITATSSTQAIAAIQGSYVAQPLITIVINSLSGGTNKYIKITNPTTGKYIKITRNWSTLDKLIIDCELHTVTVNGVAVDYTGVFPTWAIGSISMQYDDTLTTRSISLTFAYNKRYL